MAQMRLLFVCMGNICRSPMAEAVFHHLMHQQGVADLFAVDSAGTTGFHTGENPDPRTMHELARHGIVYDSVARIVSASDFEDFDVILVMDQINLDVLARRCPPEHQHKLRLMLELTTGGEVGDPYYGGAEGFAQNYAELHDATLAWIARWTPNLREGRPAEPRG